jgi:hypothetical protein
MEGEKEIEGRGEGGREGEREGGAVSLSRSLLPIPPKKMKSLRLASNATLMS